MVANPDLKLSTNIDGEFFVDSTCINCDTCRQLAPQNFDESQGYSYVFKQPETDMELRQSMEAVIACPTGSIGHSDERDRRKYQQYFPKKLDENLYYLGYHSPKSYGGASYLVTGKEQNWMIDAPRYSKHLVEQINELGGLDFIFLTHQDDVADASKYSKDFEAKRMIHYYDKGAAPDAEIILSGYDLIEDYPQVTIIPTPGHTKGHMCLLFENLYLFTGDHLNWNRGWKGLRASRRMNWYSWEKQKSSLEILVNFDFEWVLPGHGQRVNLSKHEMKQELHTLLEKIAKPDYW